jgi:hypothetical protein
LHGNRAEEAEKTARVMQEVNSGDFIVFLILSLNNSGFYWHLKINYLIQEVFKYCLGAEYLNTSVIYSSHGKVSNSQERSTLKD